MPYGIQVRSTAGLTDLSDIDSMRVVWRSRRTTVSGSVTIGTALTNGAFGFADVNDGGRTPNITVSNGVVSWAAGDSNSNEDPSSDFMIFLLV